MADTAPRPFIAWPTEPELRATLPMVLTVTMVFVAIYGTCSAVGGLPFPPLRIHFDAELLIPFTPEWSIVYLSMDVLVLLPILVLRRGGEMWPYAAAIMLETVIAGFCFLLFPVQIAFPPREAHGISGWFFGLADTLNLNGNHLPSLHVAFAVTAAWVMGQRAGWLGRTLLLGWAGAIALSTLLIHEHHVVDVVAGAGLAGACTRWASRRFNEEVLERLRVDAECGIECTRFARRHLRYFVITLVLLRASAFRWREARVLRTAFCFLQLIDDVLDGDRPYEGEPLELAAEAIRRIRQRDWDESDPRTSGRWAIGRSLVADLERLASPIDRPVDDLVRLIEHMAIDRQRVRDAAIWDEAALREHHHRTFSLSMDLLFVAMSARLRSSEIPNLIDALGWCSTMRDLEEDLAKGLCNVPADVVASSRVSGDTRLHVPSLMASSAVRAWARRERDRALVQLDASKTALRALDSVSGIRVAGLFHRSILSFANRRLPRRYPWLVAS